MICIISFKANIEHGALVAPNIHAVVSDWIIANDVHDARRQADMCGDRQLASALYRMEFSIGGKHIINAGRHLMLVTP